MLNLRPMSLLYTRKAQRSHKGCLGTLKFAGTFSRVIIALVLQAWVLTAMVLHRNSKHRMTDTGLGSAL